MSTMAWVLVAVGLAVVALAIYLFCATARIFVSENKREAQILDEEAAPHPERRSGRDRRQSTTPIQFPYRLSDGTLLTSDRRMGDRRQPAMG